MDSEANASAFAGQKVRHHILSWHDPEAEKSRHSTCDNLQALSNIKVNLMPLGGLCDIPVTCWSAQECVCPSVVISVEVLNI